MNLPLESKIALVTGASKGVGKGIALELARAGANIVVNYNTDSAGAEATVTEIRGLGRKAMAVQGNVGIAGAVDRMFAQALETFPRLDLTEAEWDRTIDTNLKGCFLCTQRAARHMREQGGGRIVNIGSGCNKVAFPNLVDYTASKGGIEMLTKSAAVELGRFQITVNCVAPGAVEIERTKLEAGDYAATWAKLTPLGRVGQSSDVGRAVVFLASAAAEFITGQTIWVDGGLFSKPSWPYE